MQKFSSDDENKLAPISIPQMLEQLQKLRSLESLIQNSKIL